MRIISSDSHVVEPPTLWVDYVDPAFRDRVPRVIRDDDTDRLVCDGLEFPPFPLYAGCLRNDDQVRQTGRWQDDIPEAAYEPVARRKMVIDDGVDGEVLFPTVGMTFYLLPDPALQQALFHAYNRWIAEFCAADPGFFKGLAALSTYDVDQAVAELRWCHGQGLKGAMVPLFAGDEMPYFDAAYEPLWAAAAELGMPLNFHSATTRDRRAFWTEGRLTTRLLRAPAEMMQVALDLVFAGVFDRHPALQVVSAENELGWLGYLCERGDYWWRRNRSLTTNAEQMRNVEAPSHYVGRNITGTFMRDRTAVASAPIVGAEALMFGTDFPHHVSTWPDTVQLIGEHLAGTDDATRDAILCGNVTRLYGF